MALLGGERLGQAALCQTPSISTCNLCNKWGCCANSSRTHSTWAAVVWMPAIHMLKTNPITPLSHNPWPLFTTRHNHSFVITILRSHCYMTAIMLFYLLKNDLKLNRFWRKLPEKQTSKSQLMKKKKHYDIYFSIHHRPRKKNTRIRRKTLRVKMFQIQTNDLR